MLQTISQYLLPFITNIIISGSITSGDVPTTFKKASVIPIVKEPALDSSDVCSAVFTLINHTTISFLSFPTSFSPSLPLLLHSFSLLPFTLKVNINFFLSISLFSSLSHSFSSYSSSFFPSSLFISFISLSLTHSLSLSLIS